MDTVEREGERDTFWNLFATLYNFIDTVSPDCMISNARSSHWQQGL